MHSLSSPQNTNWRGQLRPLHLYVSSFPLRHRNRYWVRCADLNWLRLWPALSVDFDICRRFEEQNLCGCQGTTVFFSAITYNGGMVVKIVADFFFLFLMIGYMWCVIYITPDVWCEFVIREYEGEMFSLFQLLQLNMPLRKKLQKVSQTAFDCRVDKKGVACFLSYSLNYYTYLLGQDTEVCTITKS